MICGYQDSFEFNWKLGMNWWLIAEKTIENWMIPEFTYSIHWNSMLPITNSKTIMTHLLRPYHYNYLLQNNISNWESVLNLHQEDEVGSAIPKSTFFDFSSSVMSEMVQLNHLEQKHIKITWWEIMYLRSWGCTHNKVHSAAWKRNLNTSVGLSSSETVLL